MPRPRKNEIRLPFNHLQPAVQRLVKGKFTLLNPLSISEARIARVVADVGVSIEIITGVITSQTPMRNVFVPATFVGGAAYLAMRNKNAERTRRLHEEVIKAMNTYGVIQTKFEGEHKRNWINPTEIAKTHPVFHVEPNGDLIFHKNSRAEYLKWKIQQKYKTSAGWWWRAYIQPPTVPESVKSWAKRKMQQISARLKEAPNPALTQIPVAVRY